MENTLKKVVCVDDSNSKGKLIKDEVYEVIMEENKPRGLMYIIYDEHGDLANVYARRFKDDIGDEKVVTKVEGIKEETVDKQDEVVANLNTKVNFTKSDLKDRMVIQLRDGDRYLLIGDRFINSKGHIYLSDFEDDLTVIGVCDLSNFDIMKVFDVKYDFRKLFNMEEITDKYLIWKREEKHQDTQVDWSKIEVDTKILVSCDSGDNKTWYRRYFAKYEDGKVYVWHDGATSWSSYGDMDSWKYAILVDESEEV